jgi:dTDP-4-dehydrorhamnose reductase
MPLTMPLNILLLGKNGQLGWELQRSLAAIGQVTALGHDEADFSIPSMLGAIVAQYRPQVIVNAAAYTAVDKAETDAASAHAVNTESPAVLAQAAKDCGALLVHYSTDYVFDGSGHSPRDENQATAPLNIYGASKLAGEGAIVFSGCKHLIFRTSWVYAARGGNFAKTMLRLAQERDSLSVINDQHGAPTGADWLADISAHAIVQTLQDARKCGLYHAVAAGETTWHGYASLVVEHAKALAYPIKASAVNPVPTSNFPTPAQRPLNSRLDTGKLQAVFGVQCPPWQAGVARMLREITA